MFYTITIIGIYSHQIPITILHQIANTSSVSVFGGNRIGHPEMIY